VEYGEKKMRREKSSRSRWEIILDILERISEEEGKAKKTRIMQKACLDWRSFKKYFDFLLEHGFIVVDDSCKLTEKGEDLLRRLREVDAILR